MPHACAHFSNPEKTHATEEEEEYKKRMHPEKVSWECRVYLSNLYQVNKQQQTKQKMCFFQTDRQAGKPSQERV